MPRSRPRRPCPPEGTAGEQHLQEHPQQGAEKVSVGRQAKAHGIRKGEHPLAVARFGEEAIDQPRGGVGRITRRHQARAPDPGMSRYVLEPPRTRPSSPPKGDTARSWRRWMPAAGCVPVGGITSIGEGGRRIGATARGNARRMASAGRLPSEQGAAARTLKSPRKARVDTAAPAPTTTDRRATRR